MDRHVSLHSTSPPVSLKQFVIANVNPDQFYATRFPEWNPHVRGLVPCPFHDDGAHPNLSVGLRNGGAKCHSASCAASIGNIVHFESERSAIRDSIAARRLYREFIRPVVSRKQLAEYRESLLVSSDYLLKVKREMGLSLKWIRKFNLGLDPDSHRITIPIYDQFDQCINVRLYRLPSERRPSDAAKIHNFKRGYGSLDIFPPLPTGKVDVRQPVFIMASEKETMLARAFGWEAYCSTAGEGSWHDSWNIVVKDRAAILVFDNDSGGRAASTKMAKLFASVAKSTTILKLPFRTKRKDWKDFADWVLREHHTAREFSKLIRKSLGNREHLAGPVRVDSKSDHSDGTPTTPIAPDFYDEIIHDVVEISSQSQLLNRRIKCHAIVAAKSPDTYSIPWSFAVKSKNRPVSVFSIPFGRELLRFVGASDTNIISSVQSMVGSFQAEVEPLQYITVTQIEIIPTAVANSDAPYVIQACYYFGERIEANVPYALELIPTSEIRSQKTIGIVTGCVPLARSVDKFELTPEMEADLSIFRRSEGEDVWSKLATVANYVARNFTRVYNRLDWTVGALLTWCCPIGWRFPGEPELQRGWLNTLALGDTETGKSKVAKALQKIFNCGVFVSGENCTFVGLVGGAIKGSGDRLMLRWGRIPLSDKQLVVLEELSGLSVREIADMSDVRSSGVARLDKGGINSETNSRTRLLCLSNARSEKRSLGQHLFGVHAVHELIGHGEDIARFDIITTLVDREVSNDVINSKDFAIVANEEPIGADQFAKLAQWVWSLTPEQVIITPEAHEACLKHTKKLSTRYHPAIPIFKGGSGRYKLGRIAASIAAFQFSSDSDGKLTVEAAHVEAAVKLLRLCYDKQSFGYAEYSEQMFARETVGDERAVRKEFKQKIPRTSLKKVLDTLIHSTRFSKDELQAIASIANIYADAIIGVMVRERVVRKGDANLWDITPAGKKFMEDFIQRISI